MQFIIDEKKLRKNQVNQIKLVNQWFLYEFVIFIFRKNFIFKTDPETEKQIIVKDALRETHIGSSCNSLNTLRATDNPNFYILPRNIQQIPVS